MAPKGNFRSFEKARIFARSLKLKNIGAWQKWSKTDARPKDIPSNLAEYYQGLWQGWGDFLGTGNVSKIVQKRSYRSFEEARKFARIMRQSDGIEWSWDLQRWAKIRDKKTLGDAVLDGIFPEEKIPSHRSILEQSLKALHDWIARLQTDK